ncbi:hypothetical protein PAPHI01_0643 [Pancytospora philotis]|nr:hypothetical protein PAPHI01_0643 [Pancytospora philotis]
MLKQLLLSFLIAVYGSSANKHFETFIDDYNQFGLCTSFRLNDLELRILNFLHSHCFKLISPEIPLGKIRPPAPAMHANNKARRVVYSVLGSDDPLKRIDELKASQGFASIRLLNKLFYTAYLNALTNGPEFTVYPDAHKEFSGRKESCDSILSKLNGKLHCGIYPCSSAGSVLAYIRDNAAANTCVDLAIFFTTRHRGRNNNNDIEADFQRILRLWLDDAQSLAVRIPWVCGLFQILLESDILGERKSLKLRRSLVQYIIDKRLPEYIELLQTFPSTLSRSASLQSFKKQAKEAPSPELDLFFTNLQNHVFIKDSEYSRCVKNMIWRHLPQPDAAV